MWQHGTNPIHPRLKKSTVQKFGPKESYPLTSSPTVTANPVFGAGVVIDSPSHNADNVVNFFLGNFGINSSGVAVESFGS